MTTINNDNLNLIEVAEVTGETVTEVQEYLEDDFIQEGEEMPTTEELIDHIEYQQQIRSAVDESERTGRPFDHIMGEILGNIN